MAGRCANARARTGNAWGEGDFGVLSAAIPGRVG